MKSNCIKFKGVLRYRWQEQVLAGSMLGAAMAAVWMKLGVVSSPALTSLRIGMEGQVAKSLAR